MRFQFRNIFVWLLDTSPASSLEEQSTGFYFQSSRNFHRFCSVLLLFLCCGIFFFLFLSTRVLGKMFFKTFCSALMRTVGSDSCCLLCCVHTNMAVVLFLKRSRFDTFWSFCLTSSSVCNVCSKQQTQQP